MRSTLPRFSLGRFCSSLSPRNKATSLSSMACLKIGLYSPTQNIRGGPDENIGFEKRHLQLSVAVGNRRNSLAFHHRKNQSLQQASLIERSCTSAPKNEFSAPDAKKTKGMA